MPSLLLYFATVLRRVRVTCQTFFYSASSRFLLKTGRRGNKLSNSLLFQSFICTFCFILPVKFLFPSTHCQLLSCCCELFVKTRCLQQRITLGVSFISTSRYSKREIAERTLNWTANNYLLKHAWCAGFFPKSNQKTIIYHLASKETSVFLYDTRAACSTWGS